MDQTHIHLVITHLPVYGSLLGMIVLLYGIWTRSNPTVMAAYLLFILSSAGAAVAFATGEGAEEAVENIQGVAKNMIEEHEESANITLTSFIILGVLSIAGLILTVKKPGAVKTVSLVMFCISLASFGLVARTALLGGKIRHTEINAGGVTGEQPNAPGNGNQGEED